MQTEAEELTEATVRACTSVPVERLTERLTSCMRESCRGTLFSADVLKGGSRLSIDHGSEVTRRRTSAMGSEAMDRFRAALVSLREFACPAESIPEMKAACPPSRCLRAWTGEHVAYRCITCQTSGSSCICAECFNASDHEGHDYRIYQSSSGGCCDCGDPLAWNYLRTLGGTYLCWPR